MLSQRCLKKVFCFIQVLPARGDCVCEAEGWPQAGGACAHTFVLCAFHNHLFNLFN